MNVDQGDFVYYDSLDFIQLILYWYLVFSKTMRFIPRGEDDRNIELVRQITSFINKIKFII